MLFKLLTTVIYWYKKFTTYPDYHIISEELEYKIDYRFKYIIEDDFWLEESKDWDGILDEFYVNVSSKKFRHTIVPQNVRNIVLRVKYWYNGKIYKAISTDINFMPGENEKVGMNFTFPIGNAVLVDHDDKPKVDITEKIKRYSGPRCDFHGQNVPLQYFLYYTKKTLENEYPKIIISNSIGMKKTLLTLEDSTTDLRIP